MRAPIPETTLATQFPPPESQWTEQYVEDHRNLVTAVLADRGVLARFERAELLPRSYGVGYDERVVEYPWVLAHGPTGRALDAGSTLNHAHVLDYLLPRLATLHIVSISPETNDFRDRGVSYIQADLRDLPYRDDYFDTVISLSTLEHVGMDNASTASRRPQIPTRTPRAGSPLMNSPESSGRAEQSSSRCRSEDARTMAGSGSSTRAISKTYSQVSARRTQRFGSTATPPRDGNSATSSPQQKSVTATSAQSRMRHPTERRLRAQSLACVWASNSTTYELSHVTSSSCSDG